MPPWWGVDFQITHPLNCLNSWRVNMNRRPDHKEHTWLHRFYKRMFSEWRGKFIPKVSGGLFSLQRPSFSCLGNYVAEKRESSPVRFKRTRVRNKHKLGCEAGVEEQALDPSPLIFAFSRASRSFQSAAWRPEFFPLHWWSLKLTLTQVLDCWCWNCYSKRPPKTKTRM